MFSISFLVSASFINIGRTSSNSKGSAIIRTIGLNRKSVTFHCSLVWKYLYLVNAFTFNGYGTWTICAGWM